MNDKEKLIERVKHYSSKVQQNVTIVTPKDLPGEQPFLLHISPDSKLKEFTPVIGMRQADNEDRTVPRATCSPYILGCIIGYANTVYDFHMKSPTGSKEDKGYKGGWYIYKSEFKACLRPSQKLVYDANFSDEHWLVTYSEDTVTFPVQAAGKIFFHSVTYVNRNDKLPKAEVKMYIEIYKGEKILFSHRKALTEGYYEMTGPADMHIPSFKSDREFDIKEISKGDYLKAKDLSATLLHQTDTRPDPIYTKW